MRKFQIIFFLFVFGLSANAQDIHFSQLGQTPLLLNPASAGVYDGYYRGILNYKNQWASMGKPYSTFMGSFDMPFLNKGNYRGAYFGLGAYLFSDRAGDAHFTTTEGNVSASCIVPIGDNNKLSAGIEAGITHRSVDINAIQWPNQYNGQSYDPNMPSYERSNLGKLLFFDMAAGLQYQYLKSLSRFYGRDRIEFTAGAAMFHATKLFQRYSAGNVEHLHPRIVINTALRYDLRDTRIGLLPSVLYMVQGPAYELDIGFLVRIKTSKETNFTGFLTESNFLLGLQYRYKDAIIPQVFFEVADFGIGLSYDVNVSSFSTATKYNGGIEVSIRYSKMRGALYKNKK